MRFSIILLFFIICFANSKNIVKTTLDYKGNDNKIIKGTSIKSEELDLSGIDTSGNIKLKVDKIDAFPKKIDKVYTNDNMKKLYYKNGKIKSIKPYLNGKLNGIVREYYPSGSIMIKAEFVNGKKNGYYKHYFDAPYSTLERYITYKNDIRNGIAKFFYNSGQLKYDTTYVDNQSIN